MLPIRPITAADIESYHRCLDIVCRERRYLGALQAPPLEKSRAFALEQIEKHRLMFVALAGEEVIGWCDITPESRQILSHRGELGMAVHPDHRRRGIGDRLIEVTVGAARQSGLDQVELTVRTDNHRAIALYLQKGFAIVGTSPRAIKIDGAYYDCYSMVLIF